MASLNAAGFKELYDIFTKLSIIPEAVVNDMMTTMAKETMSYQREAAMAQSPAVFDDDNYESEHIVDTMKISDVKRDKQSVKIYITFSGKRTDSNHQTPTRNAEIAFVNEFGRGDMKARPFMKEGLEKNADKIVSAGAEIYYKWQEETFLR